MRLSSPIIKRVSHADNLYYLYEFYYLREYWSQSLGRYVNIHAPQHLIIDGASIPRFFWRFAHPMESKLWVGFVIHDYLYGNSHLSKTDSSMSRSEVDLLFYDLLSSEGVSKAKAKTMYGAVKMFGWTAFRKKENKFLIQDK